MRILIKKSGFTLVELLIVIAIIAVLSIIGITIYSGIQKNARDSKRKADIDSIAKAFEVKYNNTGTYGDLTPGSNNNLFASGQFPKDPQGADYTIIQNNDTKGFRICASLQDNLACSAPSNNCFCKTSVQADPPPLSGGSQGTAQALTNQQALAAEACGQFGSLSQGLVGYWKMDEAPGAASAADSAGSNTGTYTNGATTTTGKFGQAGTFDGVNDYIDTNNSIANVGTGPFSISFWTKHNLPPDGYHIIMGNKGGSWTDLGWFISARSDGLILFYLTNTSNQANVSTPFPQNNWYHVVGIREGQTLSLYLNGQLAKQSTQSDFGQNINSSTSFKMGALPAGWGYWQGQLDDVRIYNRALSKDEINSLYNGCTP